MSMSVYFSHMEVPMGKHEKVELNLTEVEVLIKVR